MQSKIERESASELKAYLPWPDAFPEGLATWGRDTLLRPVGLNLDTYGTARMLSRRTDEQREVVTTVDVPGVAFGGKLLVEVLPVAMAEAFAEAGLRLASPGSGRSEGIQRILQIALGRYVIRMPGLAASVASLARILHVIQVEDDDFDKSYSEPDLPFSIFVSVPEARRSDATLRVAESIVHETMHLQLTLVERRVPLVNPASEAQFYSPWRGTDREASGVLHAL